MDTRRWQISQEQVDVLALTGVAARLPKKLPSLGAVPDTELKPLEPALCYVTLTLTHPTPSHN